MTRKKSYNIAEHEKSHHRVDMLRNVHTNTQQPIFSNLNNTRLNQNLSFENPSFISSNLSINQQQIRPPGVWTVIDPNVNIIDSRQRRYLKKQSTQKLEQKSKKFRIVSIVLGVVFVILVIVVIGVLLGIFLSRNTSVICSPQCTNNRYCLKSKSNEKGPKCECKPGYNENEFNQCSKSFCFSNYEPYTFINNIPNSSFQPLDYDSKFSRPYCCPSGNELSYSCCGVSRRTKSLKMSRIIGGEEIEEGIFPWVVYVAQVYRSSSSSSLSIIKNCSGTLISPNHVLTAAHCLDFKMSYNQEFPNLESVIRVFYGFVDKTKIYEPFLNMEYQRRASKIILHQEFELVSLKNDLAIIKLDVPVPRSEFVDYICLFNYDSTDNLVKSSKLYVAGWGSTEKDLVFPVYTNKLNYVDAKIFPVDSCKYIVEPQYQYLINNVTHVCAGYEEFVGKDACDQDSGGPLMVELNGQWFIYGIVSYGSFPVCAQGPAMYIRISYYYNWITNAMNTY